MKSTRSGQSGMRIQKDPPKVNSVNFRQIEREPSDSLNVESLKKGISMAESLGGVLMMNPYSTATGMYGQRYSEIKDLPFMRGVSRDQFSNSPNLQEKVFNMRVDEGIDAPSLRRNAEELTQEYAPQLGDKWEFSLNDVAALSNYLGRQRTREFFGSIRDNKDFKVPGVNKPPMEYLNIVRNASLEK
tara:strand:- start:554 stop:1114 length:561 start_codon:yes stop_codon:yes gene_type:complete